MDSPARQPVLSSGQQRFLLCLAACIVPESAGAPPQVTGPLLAAVDEELGPRPRLQQLEFKLLLFAIRWMTVPFTLRRFEHLPPARQAGWLQLSRECAAHHAARRHLGPEDPGLPRLLQPGRRPATHPLFAVEGAGQCPPASSAAAVGRLSHGRPVRHPDHRLGGGRGHGRQRAGAALRRGRAHRRARMGPALQRRRVHRPRARDGGKAVLRFRRDRQSRPDAERRLRARLRRLDLGLYRDIDRDPAAFARTLGRSRPDARRSRAAHAALQAAEQRPRAARRGHQREQPALRRRLPGARLCGQEVPGQYQGLQGLGHVQHGMPEPGQAGHQPGPAAGRRSAGACRSSPTAGCIASRRRASRRK